MPETVAAKTVASTKTILSEIIEPNDANFLGKAFGGAILSKIDLCAYACSSAFAGRICVTASFDRVDFHYPIEVGELVTLIGHVSYIGRTSVEVRVEIFAKNLLTGEEHHTNTARVTMVAIHEGKPYPVPRLICETNEDKVRFLSGKLRRELRAKLVAERSELETTLGASSTEELDLWMGVKSVEEALEEKQKRQAITF